MSQTIHDRSSEDVGNIVELGHINLGVPDQQAAIAFYVTGLGLTRDPFLRTGVDNAWINVGASQFHLPTGVAQVLSGSVHLVMPELPSLRSRLAAVRGFLAGSDFDFDAQADRVDIICPWGNRICVHAPDAARFGAIQLGMACIEIDVAQGRAAAIARFYREVFGCAAWSGVHADGSFAQVPIGVAASLRFREVPGKLPVYDGHHVQITVADFSGVHRRLLDHGLITEESNRSQYRFANIIDLDSGTVLVTLEHEVRSMRHPMYARPLLNRDPVITGAGPYAQDGELLHWRLPASAR